MSISQPIQALAPLAPIDLAHALMRGCAVFLRCDEGAGRYFNNYGAGNSCGSSVIAIDGNYDPAILGSRPGTITSDGVTPAPILPRPGVLLSVGLSDCGWTIAGQVFTGSAPSIIIGGTYGNGAVDHWFGTRSGVLGCWTTSRSVTSSQSVPANTMGHICGIHVQWRRLYALLGRIALRKHLWCPRQFPAGSVQRRRVG